MTRSTRSGFVTTPEISPLMAAAASLFIVTGCGDGESDGPDAGDTSMDAGDDPVDAGGDPADAGDTEPDGGADITPEGELLFVQDFGPLGDDALVEGETYTLWWQVTARTNTASEFRFEPWFRDVDGASEANWTSAAEIVDEDEIARDTFELAPLDPDVVGSGPVTVGVRVTIPAGAQRAELALGAESLASSDLALNRPSNPVALTIGEPVEQSDPRIAFLMPHTTAHARLAEDGAVEVTEAERVRIAVDARFAEAGTFAFAAALEPDDGPWTLTDPSPDGDWDEAGESYQSLNVRLQPATSGPEADRILRLEVTEVGGEQPYTSFTRIPLRTVPAGD